MDLLNRLLGHDAWTTKRLLELSGSLTDAELDRKFDLGHRTLRRTLNHIVGNVEDWMDLMTGWPERPQRGDSQTVIGLHAAFIFFD